MRIKKFAVVPPRMTENNEVVINVEAFERVIDGFNTWLKAYEDYITYKDARFVEAIIASIEDFLDYFVKDPANVNVNDENDNSQNA